MYREKLKNIEAELKEREEATPQSAEATPQREEVAPVAPIWCVAEQQGRMPGSSSDVPAQEPESRATEVSAARMLSLWQESVPSEEAEAPKPDSPEGQWKILKNMYRLDWARKKLRRIKNNKTKEEQGC